LLSENKNKTEAKVASALAMIGLAAIPGNGIAVNISHGSPEHKWRRNRLSNNWP
jgi:hypothetical protein